MHNTSEYNHHATNHHEVFMGGLGSGQNPLFSHKIKNGEHVYQDGEDSHSNHATNQSGMRQRTQSTGRINSRINRTTVSAPDITLKHRISNAEISDGVAQPGKLKDGKGA